MSWTYRVISTIADSPKRLNHRSAEDKMTEKLEQLAQDGWEPISIGSGFNHHKGVMMLHCLLRKSR
ncbi:MAG: hypothetical protein ACXACI_14425 [Candidatus Hodarchaeales archaeon]|jgi:hypothetical protein